jgi:hypothetical protein
MAQAMRVEPQAADPAPDRFGVLVGWSHSPCGDGINVKVQSAVSRAALSEGRIDAHHLLMTRNQALLLARYLLDATGQALDAEERPHRWRTAWSRVRGR